MRHAPRFALGLLVDDVGACAELAALAARAGFEMLGIVDSQSVSADADGPRAHQLAGRVAAGAFIGSGLTAPEVATSRAEIAAGAHAVGRAPEAVDTWWLVKANVADSCEIAIEEIKGSLVPSGNRVFRAVASPDALQSAIAEIHRGYDPVAHAALDAAANGRLSARAEVTSYLAERFAIAGTPDDCAAQVERAWRAGADRLLLTAITPDPRRFIERRSTEVMPRCLAVPPSIPTGGR